MVSIIYCLNHISTGFESVCLPTGGQPAPAFLEFFEKTCGQPIAYFVATVRSDVLRNCCPPKIFSKLDSLTPMLLIDNIGYNSDDRPIHQSIEYHPGNQMDFKLIRSR
jgi:DNA-binding GntR family transcriptional regulator